MVDNRIEQVMAIDRDRLLALAREYERCELFATDESTSLETFPDAAQAGTLRWRDIEWMVRWYYRRHGSSRYNQRRRAVETAFTGNDWPDIEAALESAQSIDDPAERVRALTELDGIDTGVATAILYFITPQRDIVMGEPEWTGLRSLSIPYPGEPTPADYRSFRRHAIDLATATDTDLVTVQRALWRLHTG